MVLLEFLGSVVSGILIAYLALTNSLANFIGESLMLNDAQVGIEEPRPDVVTTETNESDKKITDTSKYEFGGPIPRILLESLEYQRAASQSSDGSVESEGMSDSLTPRERVLASLVNIFCQYRTKDYMRTTTGTGFFIHQNGVVLTNAHVAQFLLLEESAVIEDTRCTLRTGDPATASYRAELLYISPAWVLANANLIMDEKPRGTGERDYALLYVSEALENTTMPSAFPSLSLNTEFLPRAIQGSEVIIAGYPAGALFREGADAPISSIAASTSVSELYTFGSNYADIFSVSGSRVGEQGSSGGPVVTPDGSAIGLIVTKGDDDLEGPMSLRALTLSYINRTIVQETGFSLAQNMQGNLAFRGNVFKKALAPFLLRLLTFELE